jgi:hypothetical protein
MKMNKKGEVPAEMLLAVEELNFPEAKRPEVVAALKSAGIKSLGHLVSSEHLLAKGIEEDHVAAVTSAMHEFGLWLPIPSCDELNDGKSGHEC